MTICVQSTIFVVGAYPAGTLSLVAYADQTIGIQLDGRPIEGCRWGVEESELGLDTFRAMTARAKQAPLQDSGGGSFEQLEDARQA